MGSGDGQRSRDSQVSQSMLRGNPWAAGLAVLVLRCVASVGSVALRCVALTIGQSSWKERNGTAGWQVNEI